MLQVDAYFVYFAYNAYKYNLLHRIIQFGLLSSLIKSDTDFNSTDSHYPMHPRIPDFLNQDASNGDHHTSESPSLTQKPAKGARALIMFWTWGWLFVSQQTSVPTSLLPWKMLVVLKCSHCIFLAYFTYSVLYCVYVQDRFTTQDAPFLPLQTVTSNIMKELMPVIARCSDLHDFSL